MPKDHEPLENSVHRPMRGADIGVHLLVCVIIGGGIGFALDRWLGWVPWAMLAGGFLGFAAWFRTLMKMR